MMIIIIIVMELMVEVDLDASSHNASNTSTNELWFKTQGYTQPLTEVFTNVLKSLSNISGASSDIQNTDFFNFLQLTV